MFLFTKIFHIILCFLLILIILLQPGKDSSDVFGGGQSGNQRYAARSASNPLTKATTLVAVFFMFTSITLALYSSESAQSDSQVVEKVKKVEQQAIKKENLIFELPKLRNIDKNLLMSAPNEEIEEVEANIHHGGYQEHIKVAPNEEPITNIIDTESNNGELKIETVEQPVEPVE